MITTAAMKSGFTGGLVIDYPNSARAKKYFLVLEAGERRNLGIVEVAGKTGDIEEDQNEEIKHNKVGKHKLIKRGKNNLKRRREIVLKRKQRLRRKGKVVNADSKYTGRRRKPKFW